MRAAFDNFVKKHCQTADQSSSDPYEQVEKYFLTNGLNCKTLDVNAKDIELDPKLKISMDYFIRTAKLANRKQVFFEAIFRYRGNPLNNKSKHGMDFNKVDFNALMGILCAKISEFDINYTKSTDDKTAGLIVLYANVKPKDKSGTKLDGVLKIEVLNSVSSEHTKFSKLYFLKKYLDRLYKLLIEFYCFYYFNEIESSDTPATESSSPGKVCILSSEDLNYLREKLKIEVKNIIKFPLMPKEEKWSDQEKLLTPSCFIEKINRDNVFLKYLKIADLWSLGIKLAEMNLLNKLERVPQQGQTIIRCDLSFSQGSKLRILSIDYYNLGQTRTFPKDVIGLIFIMVCRPNTFKLIKDRIDFSKLQVADKSDKSDVYTKVPSIDKKNQNKEKHESDMEGGNDFSDDDPEVDSLDTKKIHDYHQAKLTEFICELCTKSKRRFVYSTNLSLCELFSSAPPAKHLSLTKKPDFGYFIDSFGTEAEKTMNQIFESEGCVFETKFTGKNNILATAKHRHGGHEIKSLEFNLKEKNGLSESEVKAYCLLYLTNSLCPEFLDSLVSTFLKQNASQIKQEASANGALQEDTPSNTDSSDDLFFSNPQNEKPWIDLERSSTILNNKYLQITYCGYSASSIENLKPLFMSEFTQDQRRKYQLIQLSDGPQKLAELKRILKQAIGLELDVKINYDDSEIWIKVKRTGKVLWNGMYSDEETYRAKISQEALELFAFQIFELLMNI